MALLTKPRGRQQLGVPSKAPEDEDVLAEETEALEDAAGGGEAAGEKPGAEAAETSDDDAAELSGGGLLWRLRNRKQTASLDGSIAGYPVLMALKPKEKYLFRSDYFEVDNSAACIMAYVHDEEAHDGFAAFWGIDRIPDGLDDRVTAVVLEQVSQMDDKWVDSHVKQSEQLDKLAEREQSESGTSSSKRKAAKVSADLEEVIAEIQDGASYLNVHSRLFLKAPDLETLEDSVEKVTRLYIDRFGTLRAAPYAGEQRQELAGLWKANEKKRGKGFYFTSTELAGSYSLVTNGLNDRGGEYVGYMVGDVNNSAVLMDVNDYEKTVVIADESLNEYLERQRTANMWCSKLSQATMLNNGSVVHLVLDGADLDKLGPKFEGLTARVDLNRGDVNPFEMFGDRSEELAIFSSQMEKLKLMFEQLYESTDGSVASIIRSALEDTATDFYVEQGMWRHNAKDQKHRLRVVGIPHDQVPKLQMFVSYLETARKALLNSSKTDPDQLRAYNVLRGIAQSMLSTNGDLFNNHTAEGIDGVRDAKRVVYDFSKLLVRGKGVAMAQLVNIIGFAVGKLSLGDTVIIHGTEHIDKRVQDYISAQFEHLMERGGRVVYSYNSVEKMLKDSEFNRFDDADYTIFGPMNDRNVEEYQKQLHQQIPPDLSKLITKKGENLCYLRRGVSNVVFHLDLALGINPYREAQRRKVHLEAAKAAKAARMAEVLTGEMPEKGGSASSKVDLAEESGTVAERRKVLKAQAKGRKKEKKAAKRPAKKKLGGG